MTMRILIAQGDSAVAEKIKCNLIAEDFDVDVTTDGEEALSYAKQGIYGVIILDILLEKINGFDICEDIRNNGDETPIFMVTNKSTVADEVDSLESGANDFLRIPFAMPVLIARLKVLLRAKYKERSGDFSFGLFFYNQKNKKYFFNKHEIFLTSQESKVFEVLMLAEGDVVSRKTLINQIWGPDYDGDPNIVHVYIGYLRRKISTVSETEVIQTVRGIGYRLINKE